jgi:hypothetical protein
MTDEADQEKRVLLDFLQHQRDAVLSVVDGLAEDDWHRSVVPSGWTVAGFVGHLGGAERYWFQHVVTGTDVDHPFDEGAAPYDPNAPFTVDRPSVEVLGYYTDMCRRSDEVLAGTPLSAPPVGRLHRPELESVVTDVRWIVLHMIEETAAHTGHLEIARELLDGRTGLGLR